MLAEHSERETNIKIKALGGVLLMDAVKVTSAVTAAANLLAAAMTSDELAFYAAVFAQLGDTLATIAVLKDTSQNDN